VHDSAIEGIFMYVGGIESLKVESVKSRLDFTMVGHLSHEAGRYGCCHRSSTNNDMKF
jgi:hypothetical protein